jgi:hypothetical protein
MGWFSGITNIGKGIASSVANIGKSAASAVHSVGKGALQVANVASNVLDTAIKTVKTVAGEAVKIPIVGSALKIFADTPVGKQILKAFHTAEDVNDALHEAVTIGNRIEKFIDDSSKYSVEDLKNPSTRQKMSAEIVNIHRAIGASKVGKKASSLPAFKNQVDKFNKVSNKISGKLGSENVERIKKDIRQIAVLPPPIKS